MLANPNEALRSAGRYLRQFRGRVFVMKLGGDVLADANARRDVCEQLSLLSGLSIPIAVVHGAGPQLDGLCRELGIPVNKQRGRRVTDSENLRAMKYAVGAVQTDLLADLRAAGASPVGLSGLDAGLVTARKRPPSAEVNWGYVGDIERVEPAILRDLMDGSHLPVVGPITGDDDGNVFNTNADSLAAAIAAALGAEKLFFVMRAAGLLADPEDPATLVPAADLGRLRELERRGALRNGMQPKVDAMRVALENGVSAVHLVSGFIPDAILNEVFTNEGSGTMVTRASALLEQAET